MYLCSKCNCKVNLFFLALRILQQQKGFFSSFLKTFEKTLEKKIVIDFFLIIYPLDCIKEKRKLENIVSEGAHSRSDNFKMSRPKKL